MSSDNQVSSFDGLMSTSNVLKHDEVWIKTSEPIWWCVELRPYIKAESPLHEVSFTTKPHAHRLLRRQLTRNRPYPSESQPLPSLGFRHPRASRSKCRRQCRRSTYPMLERTSRCHLHIQVLKPQKGINTTASTSTILHGHCDRIRVCQGAMKKAY